MIRAFSNQAAALLPSSGELRSRTGYQNQWSCLVAQSYSKNECKLFPAKVIDLKSQKQQEGAQERLQVMGIDFESKVSRKTFLSLSL